MVTDMPRESTPSSQIDDSDRKELLWGKNIEELLEKWCDASKIESEKHVEAGKTKKKLYYLMSIPLVIFPLILGTVDKLPELTISTDLQGVFLFIIAALSGLNTFLNYGSQSAQHFEGATRYDELVNEIETILVKPRRDRMQADLQLEKIKNKFEGINKSVVDV